MANIKKSFNFRNGVQVDDDNLKVSGTGLVGIGTTVPTEALDVRGNFVVSGVSSAVNAQAGVMTVTTLNPTEIIGAGVSIVSGIVTASSGIITFYGDARFLQGMPTSQWEDTNTGLGVSSIYNTGGNVGIATSNPQSTIQVGRNPDIVGQKGVGISSVGNINASGIVTATTFVGNLTGNLTGNVTGTIAGVAASTAQLQTARLIGGVSFDGTSDINLPGVNIAGNQNTSGTAANLSGTPNILINNLSATGVSTFSDDIITGVGATVGIGTSVFFDSNAGLIWGDDDFDIFHDTQNSYVDSRKGALNLRTLGAGAIPTGTGTNVQIISDDEYMARFMRNSSVDLYYDNGLKFQTSGIGATVYNQLDTTNIVASGVVTATTELNSPLIGVGTDAPANDIQVRKSGNAEIQVTSDGGVAGLTVGRESGTGDTNNAEFRYGGGAGAPYSSAQSLDILNYGTGNFNYHLSANNAGAVAGDFHWHKGKNNTRLMTLTGIGGSLGIGITTPTQALHVAGNGFIAGNLTVDDTLTATTLSVNSTVNFSNVICGTVAGTLLGNTNSTSGISTFNTLKTTSATSNFAGIGIKTDNTSNLPLDIFGDGASTDKRLFVTADARIGIKTDEINPGIDINAVDSRVSIQSMGVGTTNPQSAVDMRFAGQELTGIFANRMYMYPPTIDSTQRGNLSGVAAGAVIYNTSTNTLQVYNDTTWISLGSAGLGDGFVNAADYGLDASKTDGTNVTAINNAIAALGTNGGTIFFPGGMFYLNAAIELTQAANENSLRFVGSGHQNYGGGSDAGGTVLRRDADDEFFNITNSRAIHFVGITFKGGAANGNGGNSGISGGTGAITVTANAGCQGYLIENCVFHGIANCIHFKGLSDSIIRGCRFRNVPSNEGNGACIKLDENGSEVIDQIRIQDCVIDGSPDGSAINTAIDGIAIYNTVSTVYVTNTSAIRLRRSFYSDTNWDGNFFYFQNSEAERANEDGFSINGTGNFVTIDNCFSCTNGQGGTGHGINIGASQNSSLNITNPNVRDNSGHGILINGPTNNCSIVNPAIGGNSRGSTGTNHGIVIGTNANNVYITGGKIGGNTDELAGTGIQGRGILIDGATHSNIRIIGANVTGNQNAEGISQNISSGTGNSIQFNAGSTVAIDT